MVVESRSIHNVCMHVCAVHVSVHCICKCMYVHVHVVFTHACDLMHIPLSETTGHLSQVATVFMITHCCKFIYKYNTCMYVHVHVVFTHACDLMYTGIRPHLE